MILLPLIISVLVQAVTFQGPNGKAHYFSFTAETPTRLTRLALEHMGQVILFRNEHTYDLIANLVKSSREDREVTTSHAVRLKVTKPGKPDIWVTDEGDASIGAVGYRLSPKSFLLLYLEVQELLSHQR
jgi:hypothetical protein